MNKSTPYLLTVQMVKDKPVVGRIIKGNTDCKLTELNYKEKNYIKSLVASSQILKVGRTDQPILITPLHEFTATEVEEFANNDPRYS